MSEYPTAVFSAFACLGFTISLIPLPWHLEAWNSGTCYYMIWTAIGCLNQFVNSVVWAHDAINRAPVWCDISTRITLGVSVGIPAASLCIQRRLYKIARMQTVSISQAEKRRAILIDSLVSVLLPVIVMALYYVVQGHRFDIFEEVGCYPVVYDTLPSYFLINLWPVLLGLISAVYCVLCLRIFLRRQEQFRAFLSSNKALTMGRYLRLMALATTEMLCTVPIGVYMIYLDATAQEVQPWKGWADTHYGFSRVDQFPSVIWRMYHRSAVSIELTRWLLPVCAIIFFAFFGFASEARRHYALAFWWVVKRFGFERPTAKPRTVPTSPKSGLPSYVGQLPAYAPPTPSYKKRRTDSLSSSLADTKYDVPFDLEKGAALSSPSLPEPTLAKDTFLSRASTTLPPSPATSECPTIDRLPFETDANHHISISDAYVASRPNSPEFIQPDPPMFHRPFSPPSFYPATMPFPSSPTSPSGETLVSVPRESEVEHMV